MPRFQRCCSTRSEGFVGREFIFQRLEEFQQRNPCGYLRIVADAGLGKTALAAEVARRLNAVAFFANASRGLTRTDQCLEPPRRRVDSTLWSGPRPSAGTSAAKTRHSSAACWPRRLPEGERPASGSSSTHSTKPTRSGRAATPCSCPTDLPQRVFSCSYPPSRRYPHRH